jgi:hypothetical protein
MVKHPKTFPVVHWRRVECSVFRPETSGGNAEIDPLIHHVRYTDLDILSARPSSCYKTILSLLIHPFLHLICHFFAIRSRLGTTFSVWFGSGDSTQYGTLCLSR